MDSINKKYIDYWRDITKNHETESIELRGIKLKIPFGIFNPSDKVTYSSSFLLDNIPNNLKNKKVLDMGTGSGVLAIKSEINNAKSVVAIDIHKKSVRVAYENSNLNNCKNIFFIWSDLFYNLVGGKFDYIFANLPILDVDFDDLYGRLLNYYENYLTKNGELWIEFASFGEMEKAKTYFQNHPHHIETLHINKLGVDWYIYKLKK